MWYRVRPLLSCFLALQGSYLCGACAAGYFLQGDGSCAQCPNVETVWGRYSSLLLLLASIVGFTLVVFSLMAAVITASGGNMKGLVQVRGEALQTHCCASTFISTRVSPQSVVRLLVHLLTILQVCRSRDDLNEHPHFIVSAPTDLLHVSCRRFSRACRR